jgi:hypothetical protein
MAGFEIVCGSVRSASVMVGRLHESVDLPDFVRRQAQAEGWHLCAAAALDHGLQKALVAELRREEVGPRAPELWWQT